MAKKDFLSDLKESLDKGKFNSDAANKINEINEKADKFVDKGVSEMNEDLKKRIEEIGGVKESISENELPELNTEYEQKMAHFKKMDMINSEVSTLANIDESLVNQHTELSNFIDALRKKYEKEDQKFPELEALNKKIEELEKKYNLNVNINKK